MRGAVHRAFKHLNRQKSETTSSLLQCSYAEFQAFMKRKESVYNDMYADPITDSNRHFDHVMPLHKSDNLSRACHYTNMQVLPEKQNLRKGSKWSAQDELRFSARCSDAVQSIEPFFPEGITEPAKSDLFMLAEIACSQQPIYIPP